MPSSIRNEFRHDMPTATARGACDARGVFVTHLNQLYGDDGEVRFEAERAREQLQRQLAAAEGRAGVLQTRVDDVLADNRALRHKARLTGGLGRCHVVQFWLTCCMRRSI